MLDFDTAQLARVLDALRGGGNHVREDEELAALMEERYPDAAKVLLRCGRWAAASAAAAAGNGMTGVILGGLGFPVDPAPHALAAQQAPEGNRTWFLYAGCDRWSANARSVSIPPGDPAAAACVPVTDPAAVMKAAGDLGLPGGPLHVQLGMGAAYLAGDEAQSCTAAWAQILPPRSEIAMLVPLGGYLGLTELTGPVPLHRLAGPARWLEAAGLEALHVPADMRTWGRPGWGRPGWREDVIPADAGSRVVAVAGRKP